MEAVCQLDELRRGAGMQAALVHDRHLAAVDLTAVGEAIGHRYPVRSANRLDATLMYLRAASWAQATALSSGSSSRPEASLIRIGRFRPATTSTFARPHRNSVVRA